MRISLTVAGPETSTDVLVDADDDATVGALATQLAHSCGSRATRLYVGAAEVPPETRVREAGLLDGAIVGLGAPASAASAPAAAGWQLHVVTGPDAGTVLSLPVGEHELGREAAVSFSDRSMSRTHALLSVRRDGATVTDLGSRNGTLRNGTRIPPNQPVAVEPGDMLGLGSSFVTIRPAKPSDAATEPADSGWLSFLRPPRMLPFDPPATILLPTPPTEPTKRRFPLAAIIAPLVLGLVMAAVQQTAGYLLFAVASPVMMVANLLGDRRAGAKDHKKALAEYEAALAAAQRRLTAAVEDEQVRRRAELPDAAETLLTCRLPGRRLWERRRTDPDSLVLRVGVADLPSTVAVEAPRGSMPQEPVEPHRAHAVPVPLPLRDVGVLGVAGPQEPVRAMLRWLVAQLVAYHPPRDLSVTLLTSGQSDEWSWWTWLPHARSGEPDSYVAAVGNDADTVTARVTELLSIVRARREVASKSGRVEAEHFDAHVVVLAGARALRGTLGLAQLLDEGPSVGVYAVCADDDVRLLPESCSATVVVDPHDTSLVELRRTGQLPVRDVVREGVSVAWANDVARALAPLRDVTADDSEVTLPDSVRLLDTLSLEPPTVDAVRARWQFGGATTAMTLGAGLDGPFTLDLRRDGPHGLIAGTTGSGKSELLQTIIASLAVGNRPDAMNFVLVDYKGGSAFKDCAYLPHTVGMVTDLDNHLVERALTSLGAELKYREHFLARVGVKDIEDYADLRAKEPSRPPLPRLLIVIDEFASMARELPDFVTGLVNVAQRGRSLGIHLILATQRPSGVVSPEIRANTNLRISLRVTDAGDSTDVLDAADAARIPKSAPGRGYARLGAGALVPFQAGRVGGRRPGVAAEHVPPPFVAPLAWKHAGYLAPVPPVVSVADDVEVTDLSVLVDALRAAAEADGVGEQRSPWLDALPENLLIDDLDDTAGFAYGLTDVPREQARRTAAFDPQEDGHLLVIGSARSGRSQLLRTLAASVARTASVADVHLYAIDCGNGALLSLDALPHCGAVVTRAEPERAARLLSRIVAEMTRRRQILTEGRFADVAEQRRAGSHPLPRLVLFIDRWEGFTSSLGEVDGGALSDLVLTILREGASLGVHAVVTGDRSLGATRVGALTDNKLALKLADRSDYSLIGMNPRQAPDKVPPGRGFHPGGLETQIALLVEDDSGPAQTEALAEIAASATQRDRDVPRDARPFRVDVLPNRITFDSAWSLLPEGYRSPFALVAVGGDDLTAIGTDFSRAGCFVVAGSQRSGKSTALAVMARSLTRTGARVLVAAPRQSPLWELEGAPGVVAVIRDANASADDYRRVVDECGSSRVVVLVDDGETLRECPANDFFRDVVSGALRPNLGLVLAGHPEGICSGWSGWQVEVKKSRQGLLLSPQSMSEGELVGITTALPRSLVGQAIQPGRGVLHLGDGTLMNVVVPDVAGVT